METPQGGAGREPVKKMKDRIKTIAGCLLRNWSTLLCFELLYKALGVLFLLPLLQFLLHLLAGLGGRAYLGQENVLQALRHPAAPFILLALFLLAGLYVYFEIAALLVYCERGWQKQRLGSWGLLKEGGARCLGLLRPKRAGVFLFLPVLTFSAFAIVSGYLRLVQIPEFIREHIQATPWLLALCIAVLALFHLLFFFYLFGLPALILQGAGFRASWRESLRLLKRRKLRTAGALLGYLALGVGAMAAAAAIAVAALAAVCRLLHPAGQALAYFQAHYVSLAGIGRVLAGILLPVLLCALIVALYHEYRGDQRPQPPRAPRSARQWAAQAAVVLALCIALPVFSESELGGQLWPIPRYGVQVVAHRAGGAFGPENTVAALERAIGDNAAMAEIDVQQLRDGTLVVLHDTNFRRTAGADLNVWDADYSQVAQLDAGSSFAPAFAGERVPTLEQMLKAAKGRIQLMIELKATGHESGLVQRTLALIRQYGMQGQCLVASMNLELLQQAKALEPGIRTVYISMFLLADEYDLENVDAYSVETTALSPSLVAQAHYQGKQVYAWTANSDNTIQKVLRCEPDGLVTDNPLLAQYYIEAGDQNTLLELLGDLFFPGQAQAAAL